MSESGFLEDGFKDLHAQREKQKAEAQEKRRAGFKQVRALDPMDANKMKIIWVKKDEGTVAWEADQAQRKELERRHQEVERKKKMLEMLEFEKKIQAEEKELDSLEKKLEKEGVVAASKKEESKGFFGKK